MSRSHRPTSAKPVEHLGRVVETVGRRVRVRDAEGERVCFLSGQRAVVGDRVAWVEARGEGGKIVRVLDRHNALQRVGSNGREQLLAANLTGLVLVQSVGTPGFRPALLDRYMVGARAEGLEVIAVLNKVDLGVPAEVVTALALREAQGLRVIHTSVAAGVGLTELAALLAERTEDGTWAFVGGSGVGKTSLIGALLPDQDVGAIGDVSAYWGTGRHTTTRSVLFTLPGGGEIADSPGIRNFTPAGVTTETARLHFPGLEEVRCLYRDCLHREGEDGCAAVDACPPELLQSYRQLLDEMLGATPTI